MSTSVIPVRVDGARGKLKIFFGAAPGVGKTYAMLDSARGARRSGGDVVVGWINTHGRPDLQAFLDDLPHLSRAGARGAPLREFDIDEALARRPTVLLLDELARVNPEPARHRRRWQDAIELLGAGIDVWTTLNVGDLESLRDVVAQITGTGVGETVPDSLLDRADAIELVDLPPDVRTDRAPEGALRRGDLLALRELALRRTAECVDAQVRAYRREHGIEATWPAAERILVCVGPGPHAARLVRAARRMAAGLRADWATVYVETPAHAHLPREDREWVGQHLQLAESLGGRAIRLSGESVSTTLLAYARDHNVTKILAGKPTHSHWRDLVQGALLDELIRRSGDIDVYVTSGDSAAASPRPPRVFIRRSPLRSYLASVLVVGLAAGLAWLMSGHFQPWDLSLVFLLATVVVATRFGRGPSILAATLGVAVFDFCFVPPYFSFAVRDDPYVLTFLVMLAVGITVSTLATRVRNQVEAARSHAQWVATLHALSRELAEARDASAIVACASRQLEAALEGSTVFLLPDAGGQLAVPGVGMDENEVAAARWVFVHGSAAGRGTDSFREARGLYLPLQTAARTVGVLSFRSLDGAAPADPRQRSMLEALAHQVAGALERTLLADEAKQIELRARTEELRNALLSSVSHDLRTPLATIMGSATTVLEDRGTMDAAQRADLARAIYEEADRLNRLVTNLLAMTRVESRDLALTREWVPLEEIVGAALERVSVRLGARSVRSTIPADLPSVSVDPVLLEQVFVNLLENAVRYTPDGTPIEIEARGQGEAVQVEIRDRGPGLAAGLERRIFEKFFRAPGAPSGGSGLGLAICRGIVVAHGGTIEAYNRAGGGAVFRFTLPASGTPPAVPVEMPVGSALEESS
jgi:two-component system, OmpR family, sensor histidine kinase KdpD